MGSSRGRCLILLIFSASLCADVSSAAPNTSVLAAEQTRRKDPLDGLRYYTGGWNINDRHYLASAGFSAAPVFPWRSSPAAAASYSYSRPVFALSLVLLLTHSLLPLFFFQDMDKTAKLLVLRFSYGAMDCCSIGCAVEDDGQGRFRGSTTATMYYVVPQSNDAAATLRNFTGLLETAKAAGSGVASLPPDLVRRVDDV